MHKKDSRLGFTWKVGWAEPAVMQSPRTAYPIGAWGRQKVTPLSLPSTCTSQLEAAAWAQVGRVDQTWLNLVHLAISLHRRSHDKINR